MKSFWYVTLTAFFILTAPAFAQKLVDPNTVAPEFREAAEKRRAEQIRQRDCAKKVVEAKVLPRDRLEWLTKCLAEAEQAQATAATHR
ncbi:MAG: hypothetical protein JWQ07_5717 [Ramlibacter sp.]|nr:hypothetical protein [Ramlibacter sp.]